MAHDQRTKAIALMVEDDVAQSQLGAEMLEEFALTVRQVQTAEDAIEHLRTRSGEVTVLVADINLAGPMDGVSLACRVSVLWPGISVIVTSGDPGARLGDLPATCVYIPKPWRPLDIVSAAERASRADHSVHAVQL